MCKKEKISTTHFFEICMPNCIQVNMKIPYLLFSQLSTTQNLVHMNVKERRSLQNKIKRNSIYYILNEIYLHMSSNLKRGLEFGQNEFCVWMYLNKSWVSWSYDFFVAFLVHIFHLPFNSDTLKCWLLKT